MENKKIVFFDFDGVLVDDIEFLKKCFEKFLKKYNITPTEGDKEFCVTYSLQEIKEYLIKKYSLNLQSFDTEKLRIKIFEKEKEFWKKYKKTNNFLQIKKLIKNLKKEKIKIGLITHSSTIRVKEAIKTLELDKLFDIIIGDKELKGNNKIFFLKQLERKYKEIILIDDSLKIMMYLLNLIKKRETQIKGILFKNKDRKYDENILNEIKKHIEIVENVEELERILKKFLS